MDRDALVRRNERMMAESRSRMDSAAYDLGYYAYKSLDIPMGRKFSDDIRSKLMLLETASRERAEMEAFISRYESDKEELQRYAQELKQAESDEEELSRRLGTALYEQCTFGILDREIFGKIYQDIERDKELAEDGNGIFIARMARELEKKRRKREEESRFASYADIALGTSGVISGNPQVLLQNLRELAAKASSLRIAHDKLRDDISSHREEFLRATHGGLEKQKDLVRVRNDEARDAITSYGTYLYEKGSAWMGDDVPDDMLALFERMKEIHSKQDRIAAERDEIAKAAKADDVLSMIQMEEDKAAFLEKEKARIEAEIASIRERIDRLNGRLENLRGEKL